MNVIKKSDRVDNDEGKKEKRNEGKEMMQSRRRKEGRKERWRRKVREKEKVKERIYNGMK